MLWLALYFPELPLEVFTRAQAQSGPLVISQQRAGREQVARCNLAASACGVRVGMALPAALALHRELRILARSEAAERRALQMLAGWAYQFSSHISFDPLALLLEVGASLKLFGGLPALLQQVQRQLDGQGYRMQCAVAPTPAAASLLARQSDGMVVETPSTLRQVLNDIPLSAFTRDAVSRELVRAVGLNTIGECLALPRPELTRRTGPQLSLQFDRLLGERPDPRRLWQPPDYFAERLTLLSEVQQVQALVFPARRLLVSLCGYLRGRGAGAQQLQWSLQHREHAATRFEQHLLESSRDADHLLELFRERIERVVLPDPVIAIRLTVDDWLPFVEAQSALLPSAHGAQDARLLERLRNRLGTDQVKGLQVMPDHRPERAWRWCEPGQGSGDADNAIVRPLWLLSQPRRLDVESGMPCYGGSLKLQQVPQRIESGWWDGADVARDYFMARSSAGECLWVFRDRRSNAWYLHGLCE